MQRFCVISTICTNHMPKFHYIPFLLPALLLWSCNGQRGLHPLSRFPLVLNEISGMATLNGGKTCWAINDGGNPAAIYETDSAGNLLKTKYIAGATNVDWEDLTRDPAGNLYVCDMGNNDNLRTNLCIYRIPRPDTGRSDTLHAEAIHFRYENQHAYPPAKPLRHFDAEACVWLRDTLWIFTKNRTKPWTGFTRLYALPAQPGNHIAILVDSFHTGTNDRTRGWVTGAALSPDQTRLALLCSDRIWFFDIQKGKNIMHYPVKKILFKEFTQKEAICFTDNHTLYLSDEWSPTLQNGGTLYQLSPDGFRSFSRSGWHKPGALLGLVIRRLW